MTRNQLVYQQNLETQRHNWMDEKETKRSNQARETENTRSNMAKEAENYRHNIRTEDQTDTKLKEEARHNKSSEGAQYISAFGKLASGGGSILKSL